MSWIFVDKGHESEGEMRSQMRRSMRGGYHILGGMRHHEGDEYERAYRRGYKHGWEDHYDDDELDGYRRGRDSRGRYI